MLPTLPELYYVDHFTDLIQRLEENHFHLLDKKDKKLITDLKSLSQKSLRLFIRLFNRKTNFFKISSLKYKEVGDIDEAIKELTDLNLIKTVDTKTKNYQFLKELTVRELISLSTKTSLKSKRKENILKYLLEGENLDLSFVAKDYIEFNKREALSYFLFLCFNKLDQSLSRFTMRDLGLRRTNQFKRGIDSRYKSIKLAKDAFKIKKLLKKVESDKKLSFILDKESNLKPDFIAEISHLKENELFSKLVFQLASSLRKLKLYSESLEILSFDQSCKSGELEIKNLYSLSKKEEAKNLCLEYIDNGDNLDLVIFCENFLNLKFKSIKKSLMTKMLEASPVIEIESSSISVESKARDYFKSQGEICFKTENRLWNSLFGLVFWDLIFENKKNLVQSEFDFLPSSLTEKKFYLQNKNDIEERLLLIKNKKFLKAYLLKVISTKYGLRNGIFKWKPILSEVLFTFVSNLKDSQNLGEILRAMSKDYPLNKKGFPDLMRITKEGEIVFTEVKSENDKISTSQLRQIRFLKETGFNVDVLRTKKVINDNKTYVVVDVETTGGRKHGNRVTEIGCVKIKNGEVIDEFQTLLNPQRFVPLNITKLTGISNSMVENAPLFEEIEPKLSQFMRGATFVAHNVGFDYWFFEMEYYRLGKSFNHPKLCTVKLMREEFPGLPSYSLKNLSNHFDITLEHHHRALDDAKAASKLLLKAIK